MPAAIEPSAPSIELSVAFAGGNIYLSAEICDQLFRDARSVALLLRDKQLFVIPLYGQDVGGLLLKIRNMRGDRVIHAQEFHRQHDLPETSEANYCAAQWDPELHALSIRVENLSTAN